MKKEKSYDELLFENEVLRFALDKIHEGVYITDENGVIIEYNKAVQEAEGFLLEDVIYHTEQEIYGDISGYNFITDFSDPIRKSQKAIKNYYYEYGLGYGQKSAIMMNVFPFVVDGKTKGVCTIGRNLNYLKDFLVETLGFRNQQNEKSGVHKSGAKYYFENIVGKSAAMSRTIERAKLVAKRDSPVLIYGETGTGKELLAQSIHNGSLYLDGPFVSINCAAIPETLLESILFGVAKGSFTGAVESPGLFEQAEGGSLFLDEINSMPLSLQAKLLRAIQEKSVRRVGGDREIPVNCRMISAVNRAPQDILEHHLIRDDLFFRLATIELKIPPLRDRKEDIEYLVYSFIHKFNMRFGLFIEGISPAVYHILMEYDWPGNIRELENLVESSMNMADVSDKFLESRHFSDYFQDKFARIGATSSEETADSIENYDMKERLRSYERKLLKESLMRNDYNVMKVAGEFGVTRQNIYHRLKKLGIEITHKKYLE